MTTEERLRRRQLTQGRILIAMGLVLVVSTLFQGYQRDRDRDEFEAAQIRQSDEFRTCIAEQFIALTDALNARDATTDINSEAVGNVFDSALGATSSAPVVKALRDWREAQDRIERIKRETPYPDYPQGRCR